MEAQLSRRLTSWGWSPQRQPQTPRCRVRCWELWRRVAWEPGPTDMLQAGRLGAGAPEAPMESLQGPLSPHSPPDSAPGAPLHRHRGPSAWPLIMTPTPSPGGVCVQVRPLLLQLSPSLWTPRDGAECFFRYWAWSAPASRASPGLNGTPVTWPAELAGPSARWLWSGKGPSPSSPSLLRPAWSSPGTSWVYPRQRPGPVQVPGDGRVPAFL